MFLRARKPHDGICRGGCCSVCQGAPPACSNFGSHGGFRRDNCDSTTQAPFWDFLYSSVTRRVIRATHVKMVKKRASKYDFSGSWYSLDVALTRSVQRSQQEGSWPRQARPLLQLLAMRSQGQGRQEIHHPQHGRVRRYPYVDSVNFPHPTATNNQLDLSIHQSVTTPTRTRRLTALTQVISRMPPSSPSTPSPRCT